MTVIAIDGPAAAGKGTLARALAARLGFAYLDTGALYRGLAYRALREGIEGEAALADAALQLRPEDLAGPELRRAEVAAKASEVAALPKVRAALLAYQRNFAARPEGAGAILDGRDIGTVICPDAQVKLFVTAAPEIRATRRFEEMRAAGQTPDFETVLADVKARDARDAARETAPLKPAEDALLLDTSKLSIDAAFAQAMTVILSVIGP